jgi:mono/diheme cytochrome c family protein
MNTSHILFNKSILNILALGITIISLHGCGGASEESPPPSGDPNKVTGSTACLQDSASLVSSIALADAAKGGKLYDKWWAAKDTPVTAPTTDHPLWSLQSTNTRVEADTWRCKECHGWDYKGVDGVYGDKTNSHYTGFPGIFDASANDPIDVYCAIHSGTAIDADHNFSNELTDSEILHLTKFITASQNELANEPTPIGVTDTDLIISDQGMPIGADPDNGALLYADSNVDCASSGCHGADGTGQHEAIGTLADDNPWETLHKIRFGHPGSNMPAFSSQPQLTIQQSIDIIAYAQNSLPAPGEKELGSTACLQESASLVSSIALADTAKGGKLYDKWWAAIPNGTAPTTDHALWSQQSTNTRSGADTWRCKECHGWDYKGVDGVYGDNTNSHYTGFPGIFDARTKDPIDVYCAIHSGTAIDANHNFSDELSMVDILHLTKFITASQNETSTETTPKGIIDVSLQINEQGTPIAANPNNGETLFADSSINCASSSCHGTDGTVQHEAVGSLAEDNPWETLHKIRFGHPGSSMPAYSSPAILTLQQSMDIIAFAQNSLPKPQETGACLTDPTIASLVESINLASAPRGGRMYDKWWIETDTLEPTVDHPLWGSRVQSAANTNSGSTTWRCKECHGWDYKGVDGVYGDTTSSHYTGFPGVISAQSKAPLEVFCAIHSGAGIDENHNFSNELSSTNILHLTKFLLADNDEGLIDSDRIVNPATGESSGNNAIGKSLYESAQGCSSANCHGLDGAARGDANHTIGALSLNNPWEVIHKIRFSHPGSIMPAYSDPTGLAQFNVTEISHIISYAQIDLGGLTPNPGGGTPPTTPEELAMIALGGRLFDNWISEKQVAAPPVDNPLWVMRDQTKTVVNNGTGVTTWRCKECHGWDYRGKDGAYADGSSHYTGFPGVWNTTLTEEGVILHLTNGFYMPQLPGGAATVHNFGGLLTAEEIQALAKFIKYGVVDTTALISDSGLIRRTQDSYANGQELFSIKLNVPNGNCAFCHDADGRKFAPDVILGDIAVNNPWEMLHKVRFGQPPFAVSEMSGMMEIGLTLDDAVDVVFYSQGLPQQ